MIKGTDGIEPVADPRADQASQIVASFLVPPGLYIHVPFCESVCPFCPYNKIIYRSEIAAQYFAALNRESDLYVQALDEPYSSLYIGGGTPTLCLDDLADLIQRLPIAGERAIEMLPNHATQTNVSKLRAMNINYVSLGAQSFNDDMLQHLHRPNSAADNQRALENTLGNFECVDVDLIFDVAFGDERVFLDDVEFCFKAGVDQISTYPMMRFGFTPFGKAEHDRRTEHRLLSTVTELGSRYGYERRSVWTFNKLGQPTYTSITREFYLGLGAGAATYTGGRFLLNHFSVSRYVSKLANGALPIARVISMRPWRAATYYLFWQAYTGAIDVGRFQSIFPRQQLLRSALTMLAWLGNAEWSNNTLRLTLQGYDLYHDLERWVTYHLIEPLWKDMMREHEPEGAQKDSEIGPWERVWLHLIGGDRMDAQS